MLVLPLGIAWIAAVVLVPLNGRRRWVGWLAVSALAASFAATVWLAVRTFTGGPMQMVAGDWPPGIGITLRVDELGASFAAVSIGALLVALIYEVLNGVHERIFPTLVLFMAAGLTGLFFTSDVFNFYVFFEISMVSAFVMAGYGRENRQFRAALSFTVVNMLGSVIFLSGVAALYHVTGTLDMQRIAALVETRDPSSLILIAALIFVAFSIKLGLFPFHFWLPPVYRDSWPAVAAIFAGPLANIGSYGLVRFAGELMAPQLEFGAPAMLVLGAVSIIYGALQAITVRTSSEALAYSAIGDAGYILLGIGIGGSVGITAAVLFALINAVNKVVLFLSSGLRGWLVGAAFVVGAFSVAGVPPAGGFFGKLALFQASIATGSVSLVVLLFAGGALSFIYMFRIYQRGFWDPDPSTVISPLGARIVVLALAIVVIVIGVYPEPLLAISQEAASVLLEPRP